MQNRIQVPKLLGIVLALLLSFLCTTEFAYARGGGGGGGGGGACFASETPILTPAGYKSISQLRQGDQVISYSLTKHQPEVGTVGAIQENTATEYYVINNVVKVTATHPFYVSTSEEIKQVEVKQLKVGDQLIGEESILNIFSLQYVEEPIPVYNLISIAPNHNFYAGGFLVHNKGGIYGRTSAGPPLPARNLPVLYRVTLIFVVILIPVAFLREIYNFIRFRDKEFTEDEELIKYTQAIAPEFTNRYSVRYWKGDDCWGIVPFQAAVDCQQYQHLISYEEMVENICRLFVQYQHDWMNKDFSAMKQYIAEPFYTAQHKRFQRSYGESVDIVYLSEAPEIAPLRCSEEQDEYLFEVQINARMINFVVSPKGYVIRGEPLPRSFTEYWTFRLDSASNWWLTDINQLYFAR